MIAFLSGKIKQIRDRSLVLDVQGVGYEVNCLPVFLEKLKIGQEVEVFTHLYVREDAMEIFGFLTAEEVDFFKSLISVSGVGPKSALTIMSLASVNELKSAIAKGDASLLTKVSGIGKKTAQRLIVELRTKLEKEWVGSPTDEVSGDSQAIDGLVGLGYSVREAREALGQVSKEISGVGERIKAALKLLGRKE